MIIKCAYIHTRVFTYVSNHQIAILGQNKLQQIRIQIFGQGQDKFCENFFFFFLIYSKTSPSVDSIGAG